jgi:hypothetical protein
MRLKSLLMDLSNLLGFEFSYDDKKTPCENLLNFLERLKKFLGG